MAPSAGHLHKLVVRNVKLLKAAWKSATQSVRSQLPVALPKSELQSIPVRANNSTSSSARQVLAHLKSSQRYLSTRAAFARQYSSTSSAPRPLRFDRASFPVSKTSTAVSQLTGRAPFASTLRPNLTGGALPRTAGGYSLGAGRIGGKRFFSHGPAAPANVVQNVSQAVRAFWLGGQKAHFDGVDPVTGSKRYRTVSAVRSDTQRRIATLPRATPGSHVDFKINPTITALLSLSGVPGYSPATGSSAFEVPHLNTSGLMEGLEADFSRALADLAAVRREMRLLASLGDLPLSCPEGTGLLRVHFPGCDATSVERLCEELGVTRGIVHQDPDFDAFVGAEIALLFPHASSKTPSEARADEYMYRYFAAPRAAQEPIEWQDMLAPSPRIVPPTAPSESEFDESQPSAVVDEEYSTRSELSLSEAPFEFLPQSTSNPWASDFGPPSSPEGYESMSSHSPSRGSRNRQPTDNPLEYQDFEGIWRFMEMLDDAGAER